MNAHFYDSLPESWNCFPPISHQDKLSDVFPFNGEIVIFFLSPAKFQDDQNTKALMQNIFHLNEKRGHPEIDLPTPGETTFRNLLISPRSEDGFRRSEEFDWYLNFIIYSHVCEQVNMSIKVLGPPMGPEFHEFCG